MPFRCFFCIFYAFSVLLTCFFSMIGRLLFIHCRIMSIEKLSPQGITLYSHHDDFRSHWIRFILAEKQIKYQSILCDYDDEDVQHLSPYQRLPVLLESPLTLYHCCSIAEYIDDRYRQAKLFADAPMLRAEQRQYLWRFETDWFSLVDDIVRHPDSLDVHAQQQAKQQLSDTLISLTPLFQHFPYFLSEQFSILDCMLAPILLRLRYAEVSLPLPHCRPIYGYMQRIFQRPSFKQSLTLDELHHYQHLLG